MTKAHTSDCDLANINPFRYRGYVYDSETGLYYLKSRYYDPVTGRCIVTLNQISLEQICLHTATITL